MVNGLYFSRIFTLYLYYTVHISKREYERLSKLLRITKWLSQLPHVRSAVMLQTAVISLSTQYEREPLYFHISNVSHWRGLIATHFTNAVPPAAYVSLRNRSLTLRVQVTLFAQYHFNAGQLFRSLGYFQQFRRCLIKPAAIHTQRHSQNLVKPAPPL